MSKLTKKTPLKDDKKRKYNKSTEQPFIISFVRKLEKGYRLDDLEKSDLKTLQNFFDIASQLTVNEMDKKYRRKSDKNDILYDEPVIHYGASETFRIHGIYIEGRFEVLRIDPNHKIHD